MWKPPAVCFGVTIGDLLATEALGLAALCVTIVVGAVPAAACITPHLGLRPAFAESCLSG